MRAGETSAKASAATAALTPQSRAAERASSTPVCVDRPAGMASYRNRTVRALSCNATTDRGVPTEEMTTITAEDLNERLAADPDGAFPDLVRSLQDGIYSGVLQLTRNQHDAQDITQETFVRVYRALSTYDPDRIRSLRLRPWTWTIALNLSRNRARSKGRKPEIHDEVDRPDPGGDPASQAAERADLEEWRQRLARLSGPQRTAVVLYHVVGLPHAEIAAITGRSESTTRSDLRRGLGTLRTIIQEES